MKISWKTYLLLLCFTLASLTLLTVLVSLREARGTLEHLRVQQKLLAVAAASQVEAGYHEQAWPFELLATVSRNEDFACWRIVDGNGQTVLAHAAERHVGEGEPVDLAAGSSAGPVHVRDQRNNTEAWVIPMRMRTGLTPWTFWLGFHTRAVQAKVCSIVQTNVLFGLGIAVALIPISLTSTRRLLRPLDRLTQTARELERGNIEVALPAHGNDEIGQLVGAFGAMVEAIRCRDAEIRDKIRAIQQARDELEVRVQQRTVELSTANQELTREIAVRRQAEEELRESEERYRYLYEEGLTANVLIGVDGKILDCNKLFPASLSYSKDDVIGRDAVEFFVAADRERALDAIGRSLNSEHTQEMEIGLIGTASVRTFLFAAGQIPVRKAGEMVGVVLSAVDITERKQAEAVLRESEERYRRLLESVTDYICSVKVADGRVVSTSHGPGCVAVTGYAPWEYDADPFLWYRMIHEGDRQAVREHSEAILAGDNVGTLEHRIIHKDGSVRWISNTPVVRKDDKGQVVSYDALIADITTRKQAEEMLRDSENRLRTVLDNVQSGILMIDADTHLVTDVNTWALRLIGLPKEQVIGKLCHRHICPAEHGRCPISDLGQTIDNSERMLMRGDGTLCPVIKAVVPLTVKGRRYLLESFLDISERKHLEDELRRSKEQLEQRVAERTKELLEANRQIRQAQSDLVQAEKMGMLGQLVAGVAHEINTPTGAIMNVAGDTMGHLRALVVAVMKVLELPAEIRDWLTKTIPDLLTRETIFSEIADRDSRRRIEQELRQYGIADCRRMAEVMIAGRLKASDPLAMQSLAHEPVLVFLEHLTALKTSSEICHASVQKIARIVKALRYYSRSGEGEMFDINVNESIDNTLVILQNRVKRIARVERNYRDPLPSIRCGPDISQVWTNVLSNACDAIEGAGGEETGLIRIATMVEGQDLVVEVFNEGPHVPQEIMSRIFDPFFTTKPMGKGTGLGLSICTGILSKYGGRLAARNDAGGVTFRVSLPLTRRDAHNTGLAAGDAAGQVAEQATLTGVHP